MSNCCDCAYCVDLAGTTYKYTVKGTREYVFATDGTRVVDGAIVTAVRNNVEANLNIVDCPADTGTGTGGTTTPATTDTQITCATICDDVNGDGSNIVTFVRRYRVDTDLTTNTTSPAVPLGDFTDHTYATTYTIQGTEVDCATVGTELTAVVFDGETLTGPTTWSRTDVVALNVTVTAGTVTVNTPTGPQTLVAGQNAEWSADGLIPATVPTVTISAGATATLTYNVGVYA